MLMVTRSKDPSGREGFMQSNIASSFKVCRGVLHGKHCTRRLTSIQLLCGVPIEEPGLLLRVGVTCAASTEERFGVRAAPA